MSNAIKAKLEELSILLVMGSADDPSSLELPLQTCGEIQQLAAESPEAKRICAALQWAREPGMTAATFSNLVALIPPLTRLLDGDGAAVLPHEQQGNAGLKCEDVATELDPSFVTEFIETHSMLLEEFEASVVQFSGGQGADAEEFSKAVKRYLHNLKGDAGSVGLPGIERACHRLEDVVVERGAGGLTPQLILFKEWSAACMRCIARGEAPPKSSAVFIAELEQSLSELAAPGPESKVEHPVASPVTVTPVSVPVAPAGVDQLPSTYAMTGEADILVEFSAEAEEHLTAVESIILEQNGNYSKDNVDAIFRAVHSIKGGSAYFSLIEMSKCSHVLENLLHEVRDGKRVLDETLRALLLAYIDLQKDVLTRAKSCSAAAVQMTTSSDAQNFLASLDAYAKGATQPKVMPEQTSVAPVAVNSNAAAPEAPAPAGENAARGEKLEIKNFVKVDTTRLDLLIDSIGEMVIYSAMLVRQCREKLEHDQTIMNTTHRVEKFARDLQDIGMSMRLIPIKGLFQKMSRLVWDAGKKLGKQIEFEVEGEDTELDRNLIDKLADPLMHMVRNAIDHGIESPEVREKAGKPRQGSVRLSAFHSGGSIHIQVIDDGKGLDPDKLIAKAIEKGIIRDTDRLTKQEAFQLIFAAGFSTAAVVTDLSGRGVGMDVVRRNVESLRGRIQIESEVGKGSVFTIELPLTLAIIDGIQVSVGQEYFIVPSLSIVEFVRPSASSISHALDQGQTFLFRNRYLPVFSLATLYGIEPRAKQPTDGTMIVVENGSEQVALLVDSILGEYSTVIKSLGPVFADQKGLAGCAIMPDGGVALILDVRSLVELARKNNFAAQLPAPGAVTESSSVSLSE